MAAYDVFISYRRVDSDRIEPLKEALEQRGLKVWFDRQEIDAFEDFSQRIQTGLIHAKALFAWYSIRYPESRACQWELTAAYLAAQREGDPCRRVLVVNPEPGLRLADSQQGARTVHALVARTVRFESAWTERRETLRRAAIAALNQVMPLAADIRGHVYILLDIPHARELTRTVEDIEKGELLHWVAYYDFERGDYRNATVIG